MKNNHTPSAAAPGAVNSKTARALLRASNLILLLRVPLVCAGLLLVAPVSAFAQTGPIFNGNASRLGQIIRAVLLLAAALVAVLGVFFAIKAIKNFGSDKEWGNQAIAVIFCFGLSTFLAVMWAIAQGNEVDVGLDF